MDDGIKPNAVQTISWRI